MSNAKDVLSIIAENVISIWTGTKMYLSSRTLMLFAASTIVLYGLYSQGYLDRYLVYVIKNYQQRQLQIHMSDKVWENWIKEETMNSSNQVAINIRNNIDYLISKLSGYSYRLLDEIPRIRYAQHIARLHMVRADIKNSTYDVYKALIYIEIAERTVEFALATSSLQTINFIRKNDVRNNLELEKAIVQGLKNTIEMNTASTVKKNKASSFDKKTCATLKYQGIRNEKVNKGLGCTN